MKRPTFRRSIPDHAMSGAERNSGRDGALLMLGGGTVTVGKNVALDAGPEKSHIYVQPDAHLVVGDGVRFGQGAAITVVERLEIGSLSSIGAFCMIADTDFHVVGDHQRTPVPRPVTIGERVSIGPWTVILPGTTIGDDAAVRAGSVVAGTVPKGATFGGVPARAVATDRESHTLPSIVQALFALAQEPAADQPTNSVKGWDSLGALRVLMSIEDLLGVRIDENELVGLETVGDWTAAVGALLRRQ